MFTFNPYTVIINGVGIILSKEILMTCIVGFVSDDKVYMGGDSAGCSGFDIRSRTDEKVFIKDDMVYGFTTSFRMGQVLRFCFNRPEQHASMSDYEYMCSSYITELIKCFSEHGYLEKKNEVASGGTFLVGYKGVLYRIENDFQVGMVRDKYDACGCGEYYALGALDILTTFETQSDQDNREVVTTALKTAEKFSAGVRGPFTIEVI